MADEPAPKRLRYYYGQFLQEADFAAEQQYHIEQRRRVMRRLRTPGIIEGLAITVESGRGRTTVLVGPGSAIDRDGELLLVTEPLPVTIPADADGAYRVVLTHAEQPVDPSTVGGNEFTRIQEQPSAIAVPERAIADDDQRLQLARLQISGTTIRQDPTNFVPPPRAGETVPGDLSVAGATRLGSTLSVSGVLAAQSNVGVGSPQPNARLSVVADGAAEIAGTAMSTTLRSSAGVLGQSVGSELALASIGYKEPSGQNTALGIRALRTADNANWNTTSIGLTLNVNQDTRAGAHLWLHANGNVGVGVSFPSKKLHVEGGELRVRAAHNGATADIGAFLSQDLTQGIGIGNNRIEAIGSAATQHILLVPKGSGFVGIGAGGPSYPLHITAAKAGDWQMRLTNGSTNVYASHASGYGLHIDTGQANDAGRYGLNVRNASETHFYVRDDGNVGIGTEAPDARLQIVTTSKNTGNNTAIFQAAQLGPNASHIHYGTNGDWYIRSASASGAVILQDTGGNVGIRTGSPQRALQIGNDWDGIGFANSDGTPNAGYIRFGDNTGWKLHFGRSRESAGGGLNTKTTGALLTIQDNGNVGIGTTEPAANLHIRQTRANQAIRLSGVNGAGEVNKNFNMFIDVNGNMCFYYDGGSGGLGQWLSNSNGTWQFNPSDVSLKSDITHLDGALARVLRLNPVNFTWRATAARDLGFIAQEVEHVFPELISTSVVDGKALKGLPYPAFAVLAIAALQELAQHLDLRLAALEDRVAAGALAAEPRQE